MNSLPTGRVITAFIASPGAGAFATVTFLSVIGRAIPSAGYVLTVAIVTYGAAIVFGVPIFLLSRGWHLHTAAFYLGFALAVAMPLITIAAMLTKGVELPLVAAFGAIAGGFVFFKIVERGPSRESRQVGGHN